MVFLETSVNVYGVDTKSGTLVWKIEPTSSKRDYSFEPIPWKPLYAISSLEVSNAIDPYYKCCTFRGSV